MGLFDRLDRLADQLGELIVPDDVRAHVELGQAYLAAGNLDAAERELTTALGVRADHARAAYLLGIVRERRGDLEGAQALYQRASERPGFVEPWLGLGQLALARSRIDEAAEAYRRALDAGPTDPDVRAEAYRGLGAAHLHAGRFDRAVRELRKAVASAPDEVHAQTLLGRALLGKGDYDTARVCLERATRKEPAPPLAWASRGEVALKLGRTEDAEQGFRAALAGLAALPTGSRRTDDDEAELLARLGLGQLLRARGQLDEARREVSEALSHAPARLDLLVELGRIAAEARSPDVALEAFNRALAGAFAGDPTHARPLLEEALSIALRAGLDARALHYAQPIVAAAPDHAAARAALALAALALVPEDAGADDPHLAAAEAELAHARDPRAPGFVELRLAEAQVALRRGQRPRALAALREVAARAPDDPRPRDRYAALFLREAPPPDDVPALLSLAHRLASSNLELAEQAPAFGRLRESLDRPLVVTVMGEFNAGKSTFVNAFLGQEVAPMGVTPTTATVNLLKYGTEKQGRVLYRDERTRELPWAEVPGFLKKLSAEEARRIRLVELLYPLELLQRINVVDTPGLNSIHAEHEETARRFIEEADAVLWLFSVDQAAKASEGEALGKIVAQGRKILGVLNKIDRASEEERAQIIAHVEKSVGQRLETIVPVSARAALAAKRSGDALALTASNYPTLDATLEARFFSRARVIQRSAALGRAAVLLDEAAGVVRRAEFGLDTSAHDDALAALRADALAWSGAFIPAERRRLLEAADETLRGCAREVLDFVRPRKTFFGSNEATPADRDFLLSLLEERVTAALAASRTRVQAELGRTLTTLHELPSATADPDLVDTLALLDERVYGRYRAFFRGYLRGGAVASFFARDLPRLELTEVEVRRALERAAPLDDDVLEAELRQPLRGFGDAFFASARAFIEQRRAAVRAERFELECRLERPIALVAAAVAAARATLDG